MKTLAVHGSLGVCSSLYLLVLVLNLVAILSCILTLVCLVFQFGCFYQEHSSILILVPPIGALDDFYLHAMLT